MLQSKLRKARLWVGFLFFSYIFHIFCNEHSSFLQSETHTYSIDKNHKSSEFTPFYVYKMYPGFKETTLPK